MKNLEDVLGSWPGYQHVYPVRVQMLDQCLYSNIEQDIMLLQSRVNACCMATAKFLDDLHKTNVDISENLINNAEDVENTAFQV